jgi:nucleoside-triphosphatase THEP1
MNNLKSTLNQVIMPTKEVAEVMGISKQEVINKVNRKELIPIKKSSQGFLFYKEDIEKFVGKEKVVYSKNNSSLELGLILIINKNILICGKAGSGKSYLINDIINNLKQSLFYFHKKINVRDLYNDTLTSYNTIVNIFTKIDEKFFHNDKSICGAIASIQANNEINAVKEFASAINQSVEYVLKKIDYVVVVDGLIFKTVTTKNIKKVINNSNLCIYKNSDTSFPLEYFYE